MHVDRIRIESFNIGDDEWDRFVINDAINGTFLQTRRFLNYHPKGRFNDCSLVVYDNNSIIAAVPASMITQPDGLKTFYSHPGTTYGGIIIHKKYYNTEAVISIVSALDSYLKDRFDNVVIKITPDLLSHEDSDLLQWALGYLGYTGYSELNSYVDLASAPSDVLAIFDRNKHRNIKKCEEEDLVFRKITSDNEIQDFYNLLTINLEKYNLHPIHSLEEIIRFRDTVIPERVEFYGVFKDDLMMAGGMMFIFPSVNVIHAQNLSADYRFTEYSPVTYLYYRVIQQAKDDGYKALSWGVSTEDEGKVINLGLIRNKESYGCKYQLNRVYKKDYHG